MTLVETNRRLTIELSGGSLGKNAMQVAYVLTETSIGTSLHYASSWRPSGVLWLLAPLIAKVARGNARKALDRLKQLAESDPI